MEKKTRKIAVNVAAVAVFAVVIRLFVWPTFAPYIPLPTLFPEKSEISSVAVNKDRSGKWVAIVKYVHGGKVPGDLTISQYAMANDAQPLANSFTTHARAMPGENVARIELQRPAREEEFDVAKLGVTISKGFGAPLAQQDLPVSIHWPDSHTAQYEQEIAGKSPEQLEAQLKSLLDAGDTPSLLHAQGLAKLLLSSDARSAMATQAMIFVQTHAVWGPEGAERISSRKQMWEEILALENARAFAELDQFAKNLSATKRRMPNGQSRLIVFYDMADRDDAHNATPQDWARVDDYLKIWIKARPDSSTARVLRARMLRAQAWQIRGEDVASTVKPEQWAGFHRLIDEAITFAESCRDLCGSDPEWYATMIALYIDHSTTDERIGPTFVEGRKKFPDYPSIYVNVARKFMPRWGGSAQMLERFAQQLISEYPVQQRDEVYASLYSNTSVYGSAFGSPPVSEWNVDCSRWLRGIKAKTSKFPTESTISFAAYISAQCGDRALTREYLRLIAGKPDLIEWGFNPETAAREFARVEAWAR